MSNQNESTDHLIIRQMEKIGELEKHKTALLDFVQKFLDNFRTCDYCGGKGCLAHGIECRVCAGTGRKIVSIGVLYVELPEEARALLQSLKGKRP